MRAAVPPACAYYRLPRPRCLRLRPRFRPPGSGGSPWLEVGEGAVFTAASDDINRICLSASICNEAAFFGEDDEKDHR